MNEPDFLPLLPRQLAVQTALDASGPSPPGGRAKLEAQVRFSATAFGDMLTYRAPEDCELVVLCVDRHQHCPVKALLPHQIYRAYLKRLLAEYPDASGFTVMPVRCLEKFTVPAAEI